MESSGGTVRLKLDENLSRHLREVLFNLQHDVTTAAEEGLLSQPDNAVAAAAKDGSRMLLTLDIEFGDLRKYPPGTHPGVVLFSTQELSALPK
jgi:predicted nuclease of predicted toxin-antitoxin system